MKLFNRGMVLFLCVIFLAPTAVANDFGWFRKTQYSKVEIYDECYEAECGACHFAYQPGLLPTASWKKLLAALDDHFGEFANIDDTGDLTFVRDHLLKNAADKSDYQLSKKIMRSLPVNLMPIRITDVPYFKEQHRAVPWGALMKKGKVVSQSSCNQCHISSEM